MTNYRILLMAFKNLSFDQRQALAYHAKRGTRIVCGSKDAAMVYTDGKGGG